MDVMRRIARAEILERGGTGGPAVDLEPWIDAFRSGGSAAGKTVTVQGSLQVAAVWAAIRILSDTVGSLPLLTYRRLGDDRARAPRNRTYALLHDEPNPDMSAATLKRLLTVHMNTWGNAYLGKTFRGNVVTELWPIKPERVTVSRKNGVKVFRLRDENGREDPRLYSSREIIHMYGISLDGLVGLSPIGYARESIGAALAMDEWQNSFFRAGALPRVALRSKKALSDTAKKKLRQQWERRYGGSRRANQVAVLEEDMDVKLMSLPQKDLEFVEQRKHSVQEIARWFRVPVSLLEGDKGSSLTYATVESENLHFVQHSVRPWLVAVEEELNRDPDLFPSNSFFCEFLLDSLLRADTQTRYAAWEIALDPTTGWMKRNEVRQRENLPYDPAFEGVAKLPAALPAPQEQPALPPARERTTEQALAQLLGLVRAELVAAGRRNGHELVGR